MEPGMSIIWRNVVTRSGDPIVGIVTTGRGLTVHYKECNFGKFNDVPELWVK